MLLGFSPEETVLATAIDGFHRGRDLRVIELAVAYSGFEGCEQPPYRQILLQLTENRDALQTPDDVNRRLAELIRCRWDGSAKTRLARAPRQREGD